MVCGVERARAWGGVRRTEEKRKDGKILLDELYRLYPKCEARLGLRLESVHNVQQRLGLPK